MGDEERGKTKAYPALAISVVGASCSSSFTRFSTLPSMTLVTVRMLITVAIFTVVMAVSGGWRQLRGLTRKQMALGALAGTMLALHLVSSFEAMRSTSIAASTVLLCTEVIFVALLGMLVGNRLDAKRWGYIAVAFCGSVLVAAGGSGGGAGPAPLYGCAMALLGSLFSAIYTLTGQKLRREGLSTTCYTYILYAWCTAAILVLDLVRGEQMFTAVPRELGLALGMAVCSTFLGHSLFSYCLRFLHPAHVSAAKLAVPVLSSLAAIPLFGEIPTLKTLGGCAVVLVAVLGYTLLEARTDQTQQEETNDAN